MKYKLMSKSASNFLQNKKMKKIRLEESNNKRRLHIGSYFTDLNESDYKELVNIFSDYTEHYSNHYWLMRSDGIWTIVTKDKCKFTGKNCYRDSEGFEYFNHPKSYIKPLIVVPPQTIKQ